MNRPILDAFYIFVIGILLVVLALSPDSILMEVPQ